MRVLRTYVQCMVTVAPGTCAYTPFEYSAVLQHSPALAFRALLLLLLLVLLQLLAAATTCCVAAALITLVFAL